MKDVLILLLTVSVFFAGLFAATAYSQEPNSTSEPNVLAKFEIAVKRLGLIALPVKFGNEEFLFELDTGTTYTTFDLSLKDKLSSTKKTENVSTPGGMLKLELFNPPEAFLGPFCLRDYGEVMCVDLKLLKEAFGEKAQGIIGMNFLKKHVVQIDFDKDALSFIQPAKGENSNWGMEVPITYDRQGLPMIGGNILHSINVNFLVDTGDASSCALDNKLVEFISLLLPNTETSTGWLQSVGGVTQYIQFRIDSLSLGSFEYKNLLCRSNYRSALGNEFLSRHKVTFDLPNSRVFLKKGKEFNRVDETNMSGMGLTRNVAGQTVVSTVFKDEPAHKAGIKPNDIILDIMDKEADSYEMWEIWQLLRSGDKRQIKMTIKRGDDIKKVSVLLEKRI